MLPGALPPGGRLHVDLWWAALEPPPLDYSVGVFLLDAGGAAVAEHQGPPGDRPTTAWEAGELVFDRHTLALPPDLPPGTYAVAVTVYWYGDLEPLPANGETLVTVGTVVGNGRTGRTGQVRCRADGSETGRVCKPAPRHGVWLLLPSPT